MLHKIQGNKRNWKLVNFTSKHMEKQEIINNYKNPGYIKDKKKINRKQKVIKFISKEQYLVNLIISNEKDEEIHELAKS